MPVQKIVKPSKTFYLKIGSVFVVTDNHYNSYSSVITHNKCLDEWFVLGIDFKWSGMVVLVHKDNTEIQLHVRTMDLFEE